MPRINWDAIGDGGHTPKKYPLLPDGDYPVRIQNVKEKVSKGGVEYWDIEFIITAGDFEGRKIWDKMFFTEKALPRVKMACHRLGVNTTGDYFFQPSGIVERTCILTVLTKEFKDGSGETQARNIVPFDGYKLDEQTIKGVEKPVDPKDDLPF